MPKALITGPTAGLGRGFAEALARKGFDLVLVSRDEHALQATADELTHRFGVRCEVVPADLAVREDIDRVAALLASDDDPMTALVNNAGFGLRTPFLHTSMDDEQALLDVMVTSVLRLTHAALPGMVARGSGMVINVSSIAGLFPGGTYSAAKSWVTVFTESLAVQLQGSGVRTTAVCPGFVRTEFHERAGMDMSQTPDWMWLEVSTVVDQAFRDLAVGRPVSVAGHQYPAFARILQHGPRSLVRRFAGVRGTLSRRGD